MWEKLIQAIRDIVFLSEQAQRNTEEIKELRKRIEDLTLVVERLAFEIQRTRENEAHEREKLILEPVWKCNAVILTAAEAAISGGFSSVVLLYD
jgi:archaellum component FlaC